MMVMIVTVTYDETGGRGLIRIATVILDTFNPAYMIIWMMIPMMMTIIDGDDDVQPLQTILCILQGDGLLTT